MISVEKKDLDWGSLDFDYHVTDYSYVCNYKDGAWEEGGLTTDHTLTLSEDAGIFHYCQEVFEGLKAYTTEDGSMGERGFVTQHPVLQDRRFDFIYTCGPRPMMAAIAAYARQTGSPCEVSLENTMACGIGACLCCVEDTRQGHQCVCTAGPVFNIEQLKW